MLKKIKKFKVHLRPSFVLRNLKRKLNLESVSEELEKETNEQIAIIQTLISPSAIYNTYSKMQTPEPLSPLWENAPSDAISLSLITVTIGATLENEIEKSRNGSQGYKDAILDSIARESLEQCIHFVAKLIQDEAKAENCEITPSIPAEPIVLKHLLFLLESEKADIHLGPNGNLTPLFSSASFCFWNPVQKLKSAKNR